MADLPDWMRPPRAEGWLAEDLDDLPEAPSNTELIDGALVFRTFPQRQWHSRVIHALHTTLDSQAADDIEVSSKLTVRLDRSTCP